MSSALKTSEEVADDETSTLLGNLKNLQGISLIDVLHQDFIDPNMRRQKTNRKESKEVPDVEIVMISGNLSNFFLFHKLSFYLRTFQTVWIE